MHANIQIREAVVTDAAQIAHIQTDAWRVTYQGIVNEDFLLKLDPAKKQKVWEKILTDCSERVFVGLEEGNIIGFVSAGENRDKGGCLYELYALYLHQNAQKKGIGRALFETIWKDLQLQKTGAMIVWVLEANPACGFYEYLGGKLCKTENIQLGAQILPMLGYEWASYPTV